MKPVLLVLNLQVPAHLEQMVQTFPDFDVIYAPEADQAEAAIAAHGARVQCVCTIGATGLSAAQMQRMPTLSLVCAMGAGYENIDVAYAKAHGIAVGNGAGTNDECVADHAMGLLIAASTVVGWWACTTTARHMRVADPGSIVWDEVVAFWLVLWLAMPMGFWGQLTAFALFRFFDAAKPGPVGWADSLFKGFGWRGGWGILWDDFVAAFCTLLVVALWRF